MNEQQLAREKAAFLYSAALEDGDFTAVTTTLAQAEQDPILEQMLLELNAAWQVDMEAETKVPAEMGNGRVHSTRYTGWRNYVWLLALLVFTLGAYLAVEIFLEQPQTSHGVVGFLDVLYLPSQTSPSRRTQLFGSSSGSEGTTGFNQEGTTTVAAQPDGQMRTNEIAPAAQAVTRLIIRNGSIVMVVEDPRGVREQIEGRVSEMAGAGAFVVSSTENGNANELPVIRMTIRVPVTAFDETMDWLADTAVPGTNPQRTETAQDVTEEYVDLQARLESMMVARDRLLEIMQNAETTEDLLRTEAQLTAREAEIEALQGRIQYLQQAAALSLIDIQLNPYILSQPIDNSWKPAETVRRAFEGLINTAQNVADFLIVLAIAILPWLILLALFVYLVYRFVQRRRMKSAEAHDA